MDESTESLPAAAVEVGQTAAAELAQRMQLLAELMEHPRTNARSIDLHAAEARRLVELVGSQLLEVAGVYA